MESSDMPNCTVRYRVRGASLVQYVRCGRCCSCCQRRAVHITFFWTRRGCTGAARVKTPPPQEAATATAASRYLSDYNTLLRARELENHIYISHRIDSIQRATTLQFIF
uniref:Uncharacterized protein n=1 Tax=Trichogramma kaykai TaxID=54128 RepID=A0ABD2W710_9HYME